MLFVNACTYELILVSGVFVNDHSSLLTELSELYPSFSGQVLHRRVHVFLMV